MLDFQDMLNIISSARYFPGDPPFFETVVTLALAGLLPVVLLLLVSRGLTKVSSLRRLGHLMRMVLMLPLAVLGCALLGACFGIMSRHFGEWAKLKKMLQIQSARIEEHVKRPGGTLSPSEMAQLEIKFLTPAPSFKFKALDEPVQLRVMANTPPYVGLDFGNGANAVLDPETMICVYAD